MSAAFLPWLLLVGLTVCEGFPMMAYIVGGWITNQGAYPHMAVLGRPRNNDSFEWFCGGSLISARYVLTAAHCANSQMSDPPLVVRLGEFDLSTDDDSEHQDVAVASIVHHPAYNGVQAYNDIALIRMNQTITFSRFIRPACLWQLQTLPDEHLTAIGWGRLGYYGDQPAELHEVDLPLVDQNECNRLLSSPPSRRLRQGVLPSQICAGELTGGKDTCEGDSGGPLQVRSQDPSCRYDIVGITSIGGICGTARKPGVYTRVSYYIQWIDSIVWKK
ncbi:serine protease snake-like [Sabethes cyaneus]|uniref:serine protease snake-like n=1 Tax=Sabethes cyaneus TaxID=53552 RepID=UPI00237E8FCD|nr:serine protease snake-like [Sabethes cyaneus]